MPDRHKSVSVLQYQSLRFYLHWSVETLAKIPSSIQGHLSLLSLADGFLSFLAIQATTQRDPTPLPLRRSPWHKQIVIHTLLY